MATGAGPKLPLQLQGRCLCERNKFRVNLIHPEPSSSSSSPPSTSKTVLYCHCGSCRRHAAAAWATWIEVPPASISWETRDSSSRRNVIMKCAAAPSGNLRKVLCSSCNSILLATENTTDSTRVLVAAGALDDDENRGEKLDEDDRPEACPSGYAFQTVAVQDRCIEDRAPWYPVTPAMQMRHRGAQSPAPSVTGSCACGACVYRCRRLPGELQVRRQLYLLRYSL